MAKMCDRCFREMTNKNDPVDEAKSAELLEKCRRALRAERAYQDALHARVGSRYGAERRDRELAAARSLRDRTAKELGL